MRVIVLTTAGMQCLCGEMPHQLPDLRNSEYPVIGETESGLILDAGMHHLLAPRFTVFVVAENDPCAAAEQRRLVELLCGRRTRQAGDAQSEQA